MRYIAAFLLVLVGCGDVSTAGPGTGGAGGDMATADASGTGGAGGQGGAPPSCNIPIGQVSGTDTAPVWNRCGSNVTGDINVTVVSGAVQDFFGQWPTVGSYTVSPPGGAPGEPSPNGQCNVDIRYERPAGCVQGERLFVHLVVPAI